MHGHEVDFLIGRETAIEVKSAEKISNRDFKGLRFLEEEKVFNRYILVSQDRLNTRKGKFQALYWEDFLDALWTDKLVYYSSSPATGVLSGTLFSIAVNSFLLL